MTAPLPTVYRVKAQPPNLLPVDAVSGGSVSMIGWVLQSTGAIIPSTSATITVPAGDAAISPIVPTSEGVTYTAAVSGAGSVQFWWVNPDGSRSADPTVAVTPAGRPAVTATAPPQPVGAVIAAGPGVVSNPVVVASTVDPGPLPPIPVTPLVGKRIRSKLPEMYRIADLADRSTATGRPFKAFVDALGTPADQALYVADRIAGGELMDPARADDGWIPWLAQVAGVSNRASVPETRAVIASKQTAAQPGTPAAVVALTRTWLSGTKVCDLVPSTTAWTLTLRIRDSENTLGSPAALKAAVMASGLVPVGFTVVVAVGSPTWAQIDAAAGGTWAGLDDTVNLWQDIDSIGVTGV